MKPVASEQLNIGEGHPRDLIKVANPTEEEYITYWGKQPFPIQTKGERILLRYLAVKFGRELTDRVIGEKAEAEDKPITHYYSERIKILNSILLEVVEPYIQVTAEGRDAPPVPPEQVARKGETALDIGRRSVLNEVGIPDKPPVSSEKDVAANIVDKTPKGKTSPAKIKEEKNKLLTRAKALGIKASSQWSLERIKKTILEG